MLEKQSGVRPSPLLKAKELLPNVSLGPQFISQASKARQTKEQLRSELANENRKGEWRWGGSGMLEKEAERQGNY